MQRRSRIDNSPLHVGFINAHGNEVNLDDVDLVKSAAYLVDSIVPPRLVR
ncbi:hypothetical protein JJ691_102300 [Kutzneria sp. CA-103260]|nr:hypothetical protein JJ691_102300 [Kutzneria sp. CA-103260]